MTAPARPRLAAVLGWPVGHSLSPLIHRTWAARESANAHYIPIAVPPEPGALAAALKALASLGFGGCNITLPHKEAALALADAATAVARRAGAANMLTFRNGTVEADNSDVEGIAASLRPLGPRKSALVLGAGGAARAVLLGLETLGVRDVAVANRSAARAAEAAAIIGARTVPWDTRSDALGAADLLVNATSLGMRGAPPLEIDLSAAAPGFAVVDIVYAPLETALLKAARARDFVCVDGLEMLMHQAGKGYRAWLGREAAVDADLRHRLEAALAARP